MKWTVQWYENGFVYTFEKPLFPWHNLLAEAVEGFLFAPSGPAVKSTERRNNGN